MCRGKSCQHGRQQHLDLRLSSGKKKRKKQNDCDIHVPFSHSWTCEHWVTHVHGARVEWHFFLYNQRVYYFLYSLMDRVNQLNSNICNMINLMKCVERRSPASAHTSFRDVVRGQGNSNFFFCATRSHSILSWAELNWASTAVSQSVYYIICMKDNPCNYCTWPGQASRIALRYAHSTSPVGPFEKQPNSIFIILLLLLLASFLPSNKYSDGVEKERNGRNGRKNLLLQARCWWLCIPFEPRSWLNSYSSSSSSSSSQKLLPRRVSSRSVGRHPPCNSRTSTVCQG